MSKDHIFYVYQATNIANGHRYIGFTSIGLEKRRRAHFAKANNSREKGCPKFHNALRKYGKDAFVWQVLAAFDTASEALAEEVRIIAETHPEYNITTGGEGKPGVEAWNRKPVTCLDDGRMFVSATACGVHYGLSHASIADACRGKAAHAGGKHFVYGDLIYTSAERNQLIRRIKEMGAKRRKRVAVPQNYRGVENGRDVKGRKATGPARLSKKVMCEDDGLIFPSASAAARNYKVCKSSLIELCLGTNGRISVGGLRFKYVEDAE